jgi:DNA topoisomerase-1
MLNNVSLIASYRMVRQFSYFTKCRYLHSKSTNEVKRDKILVIVESPAKARTIQTFLPSNYVVDFCSGHVRDLVKDPKDAPDECKLKYVIDSFKLNEARLGIRVSDNFKPIYSMLEGKSNIVQRLKDICEHSSSVLLATDEDREGEAISWHLLQLLNPKVPVKRAVFHEISKEAILKSFENARDLNLDLVRSQEARRMLDRLTGYSISPLLWRWVRRELGDCDL